MGRQFEVGAMLDAPDIDVNLPSFVSCLAVILMQL